MIKDTRITLDQIEGRTVDLELVIQPVDKDKLYKKFELCSPSLINISALNLSRITRNFNSLQSPFTRHSL